MSICSKSFLLRPVLNQRFNLRYRVLSNKNEVDKEIDSLMKIPKDYDVSKVTKEDLIWRTSKNDENKQYFKVLRVFYKATNNVEVVKTLQSSWNFTYTGIKKWIIRKNKEKEVANQAYNTLRNETLGYELAAAHFIVYRGGAIKFHGDDKWIKANEYKDYNLPTYYVRDKYIEAIDCEDTDLYYEGLQNLRNIRFLKWLSFNDCPNFDDWCLDTICGQHYKSLVYLDLRNCPNLTHRGLVALWKMEKLKILYLDDLVRSTEYEMTILMLQEHLPLLDIKVGDFAEDED